MNSKDVASIIPVTPLILTFNEAANIERTLRSLHWASRVVVLDSGSTDTTETIAKSFPNVDWRIRKFDSHREQWENGIYQSNINTDYILALDADMTVPAIFLEELNTFALHGNYSGGIMSFEYHILEHKLSSSIYPAQLRIFKTNQVKVTQKGHTQEFSIDGPVYKFKTALIHDDRKTLERWVSSQLAYSILEQERIENNYSTKLRDKFRRIGVMPPLVAILAYIRSGGPWGGIAAARYAYERAIFECLLSIRLLTTKLEKQNKLKEIKQTLIDYNGS